MEDKIEIPDHCLVKKKKCRFFSIGDYDDHCVLYDKTFECERGILGSFKKPEFCKAKKVTLKVED